MNQLAGETSPYLLQHADNPVDWYPWGETALARAQAEDRPILLSIGYSACHWCHVMAHESFEDPATAAVMNRLFVNIKVDREERPDLDRIYQAAHQFITRRGGGWPLTMFLSPVDQAPFFGGTYFPNEDRYGMPAFRQVLERVADYYRTQGADLRGQADALRQAFARLEAVAPGTDAPDSGPLQAFREVIGEQVDREHGGFGGAPKFPHPTTIDRLLRHWRSTARDPQPDRDALYFAALTLQRMAEGGIYDQLGGGFCRYAVDRSWTIPHFEKMLYDNGPLLALYAQMFQISGDENFRTVARETADWVLREMRSPAGAFWSSLDADSEGQEGRFYVWTPEQVRTVLTPDEYAVLAPRFGLDLPPNFEEPHHQVTAWHLRVHTPVDEIAARLGWPESTVQRLQDSGRIKLLQVRNQQRVRPGLDDKILASWNGLMIRGLAIAGRLLRRPDYSTAAAGALDYIRTGMVVDGQLCATAKGGRARLNAYLDDYAFLLDATLELLQARWDPTQLRFAIWLADSLLERFEDPALGGFWFTAHDHEALLHRSRPMADEALPSGNGVAALALGRLGCLLGETRYLDAARRTVRAGWQALQEFPHGHCSLLNALGEQLYPPRLIIIRGDGDDAVRWSELAGAAFDPGRLVFTIPVAAADLPPMLAARAGGPGTVAYVCNGLVCGSPVTTLGELGELLRES